MLKKMRRRFIASAMAAIGAVTLVLLLAINLWNYNITTDSLDNTLSIQFAVTLVLDVVIIYLLMRAGVFERMGIWPPVAKEK